MADFWQIPSKAQIFNLDHVVSVDRDDFGDLRVVTVVDSLRIVIKSGSDDERAFLEAIGDRIARDRLKLDAEIEAAAESSADDKE